MKTPPTTSEMNPVLPPWMSLDPEHQEVTVDGNPVSFTESEFRLLHFIANNAGTVYTRREIIDVVHGEDYPATDRTVDVQMTGLRKKLGSHADRIETVRGQGYRFKEE
jgi:two-component system alkaline phosphatase synthesis response regulator PhoP